MSNGKQAYAGQVFYNVFLAGVRPVVFEVTILPLKWNVLIVSRVMVIILFMRAKRPG